MKRENAGSKKQNVWKGGTAVARGELYQLYLNSAFNGLSDVVHAVIEPTTIKSSCCLKYVGRKD